MEVSFTINLNYFWTKLIEPATSQWQWKQWYYPKIQVTCSGIKLDKSERIRGWMLNWNITVLYKSLFSLIRSKWSLNLICGWLEAFLLNSKNSPNLSNFMKNPPNFQELLGWFSNWWFKCGLSLAHLLSASTWLAESVFLWQESYQHQFENPS